MKQSLRRILYGILAFLMVATFYMIFNAGNPHSIIRFIISDTSYDILITVLLALGIAVISMILTRNRETEPVKHLLELNMDYIRKLRSKGKSEDAIAESFLKEMGYKKGILFSLAKKRVIRYLSKLD